MPSGAQILVVLGTGGTIAGVGASADAPMRYRAGVLPVAELVAGLPAHGFSIESEEVARIDSKDMDHATWQALASRVEHHTARADVRAVIVTHGTDTLEETAYFLQRVLTPRKAVIVTGAMRPATAADADGPRNLADAIVVATCSGESGVAVVFAGKVHSAHDVRKVHPYRLDAFTSGDAEVLGSIEAGQFQAARPWPRQAVGLGIARLPTAIAAWPRVAVVTSTAAAEPASVSALVDAGFHGIVVAGTGNGTIHAALEPALRAAAARGVGILLTTRCIDGAIVADTDAAATYDIPVAPDLTPAKARIDLMLRLLQPRP